LSDASALMVALALALAPGSALARNPLIPFTREDRVAYRVVAGDTLIALARRYFIPRVDLGAIQRRNHVRNPRRIPIGTTLAFPVSILRGDPLVAHVVAARGTVRIGGIGQADAPPPLREGLVLGEGASVETGADGSITLELPNGSRTSLPTRSRLRLSVLRRRLLDGAVLQDLEVTAGKADTQVVPLGSNPGRFRVTTPHATAAVRGTRFRVGYDQGQTGTEVLDGVVAIGAGAVLSDQLPKGMGATIADSGAIAKEALLPSPDLVDPGKTRVDPVVTLAAVPVPGAAAYHLQVAADAAFLSVVHDVTAPSPVFTLNQLPNGTWFVRLTAIAPSHLEGLPATFAVRRVLTGLTASAAGDASAMRFAWTGTGAGRRTYRFQLVRAREDAVPTVDEPGLVQPGLVLHDLPPGLWLWRVGVRQFDADGMTENWLPFERFTLAPPGP
jgi:hypothetical protein